MALYGSTGILSELSFSSPKSLDHRHKGRRSGLRLSKSLSSIQSEEDELRENNRLLQNDVGFFEYEADITIDLESPRASPRTSQDSDESCYIETWNIASMNLVDQEEAERYLQQVRKGFELGYAPALASEGTGGTYFLRDAHKQPFGVLKPADEEAFAPLNPRGHVGHMGQTTMRQGILSGEACLREVAAYMIDSREQFMGVPFTFTVNIRHPSLNHREHLPLPKKASFQRFVEYDEMSGNLSHRLFPVDQVHKIAILDIRMVNTDRNEGNILVRSEPSMTLVPIDHGYCLPDLLEVAWCDWIWLDWRQAKAPLSEETRAYIARIDVDADVALLRNALGIREECLRNMRICTTLLKKGSAAGLTLNQIAKIICRDNLDAPSLLETIVAQARAVARNRVDSGRFEAEFMVLLDSLMNDLVYRKTAQPSSFRVKQELGKMPVPDYPVNAVSFRPPLLGLPDTFPLTPNTSSPVPERIDVLDPRWLNLRMSI